jgi:hypothetical protein
MAWWLQGLQIALELQPKPIVPNEIERRASSYARAGTSHIWRPFLEALAGRQIYVEETSRRSEGGDEEYGGGPPLVKAVQGIDVGRAVRAEKLIGRIEARRPFATKDDSCPARRVAHLTPA